MAFLTTSSARSSSLSTEAFGCTRGSVNYIHVEGVFQLSATTISVYDSRYDSVQETVNPLEAFLEIPPFQK